MAYKTCVSIAEKTPKKLKQTLTKALKKSDYAEIRSEEHTSELQSRRNLVCRLLLEKKKNNNKNIQ